MNMTGIQGVSSWHCTVIDQVKARRLEICVTHYFKLLEAKLSIFIRETIYSRIMV